MTRTTILSGCAALVLAAACEFPMHVETVLPPESRFSDDRLPGTWSAAGDRDPVEILVGPGPDYLVRYEAPDRTTATIVARLGRLGGRTVLEVWCDPAVMAPEECGDEEDPRRFLIAVEIGSDTIATWFLDARPLLAHLETAPHEIEHRVDSVSGMPGGQVAQLTLSAPTARLAAFLTEWLTRPDALIGAGSFPGTPTSEAIVFRRQPLPEGR